MQARLGPVASDSRQALEKGRHGRASDSGSADRAGRPAPSWHVLCKRVPPLRHDARGATDFSLDLNGMSASEENASRSSLIHYSVLPRHMLEEHLQPRGIDDPRVLKAMLCVPREEFVPDELRGAAYDDAPCPFGSGRSVASPATVARMAQALSLEGHERVLEVGTGSGYGAAILSQLARRVYTVECVPDLAAEAAARLESLRCRNVEVRCGDGSRGLAAEAPFDGIAVTAGTPAVPLAYFEQLADGGRLVIPVGDAARQALYLFQRDGNRLTLEMLGEVAFVPLIGASGWESAVDALP